MCQLATRSKHNVPVFDNKVGAEGMVTQEVGLDLDPLPRPGLEQDKAGCSVTPRAQRGLDLDPLQRGVEYKSVLDEEVLTQNVSCFLAEIPVLGGRHACTKQTNAMVQRTPLDSASRRRRRRQVPDLRARTVLPAPQRAAPRPARGRSLL